MGKKLKPSDVVGEYVSYEYATCQPRDHYDYINRKTTEEAVEILHEIAEMIETRILANVDRYNAPERMTPILKELYKTVEDLQAITAAIAYPPAGVLKNDEETDGDADQ